MNKQTSQKKHVMNCKRALSWLALCHGHLGSFDSEDTLANWTDVCISSPCEIAPTDSIFLVEEDVDVLHEPINNRGTAAGVPLPAIPTTTLQIHTIPITMN